MKLLRSAALAAVCVGAMFGVSPASATITGTVYLDVPNPGDASDPANEGAALASATFTATTIDFETNDSGSTTIADWLHNPTFSNIQNGFDGSHIVNNTELVLTGQAYLLAGNNSFVVGHDDGVVLTFDDPTIGTVVNEPGPTSLVESPFNVVAPSDGLYNFTLYYTECCFGPADLVFTINDGPPGGPTGAPEPVTLSLFGAGLAGLGAMRRRRKAA